MSDKTLHSLSYTILAGLLSWALASRIKGVVRHGAMVLLIIALYGAVDELLQIPVGRRCDFYDWLADMRGGIIGLAVFHLARWLARKFERPSQPAADL